ncbi:hypothetical protein [Kitasatospora viridis]|uniref:Uncharacterized protein n=1 Tax=Kitasatospora viridis TaxID=281105 RepID=A0A561UJU4_9ACTN|nr:hypothetical protein [Kitasatospora viridis]TWF99605.1 hypothetical protein FHX73_113452 [Kitasatospora viridis]
MEENPRFDTAVERELGMLAECEAPPSTVSAARAVRQGRARIMRRRLTVLGTVVVIAATAGALTVLRPNAGAHSAGPLAGPATDTGSGSGSGSGAGSSAQPAPQPSLPQTGAPATGSDPLHPGLRFGWLPDGVATLTYRVDPQGASLLASASSATAGTALSFILSLYPQGSAPGDTEVAGVHVTLVAAPAVNGRPAYWLLDDKLNPAGTKELRWQLADGRWAELDGMGMPAGQEQQMSLRVAADVAPDAQPVPLPFRLAVPGGDTFSQLDFQRTLGTAGSDWSVRVVVSSQDGSTAVPTDITPDSVPARPTDVCVSDQGVHACVPRYDSGPDPLAALGGPDAWLHRFTLLGTDPSKWTTDVTG